MLQDQWAPMSGGLERNLPRSCRRLAFAMKIVSFKITVGEIHVQPLHPRAVFKPPVQNALLNIDSDFAVERGEITQAAGFLVRTVNDAGELGDDLINILGEHEFYPIAISTDSPTVEAAESDQD